MSDPNDPKFRGTRVRSPDLDWSQVRETVLMLELAASQVDAAMRDSNASVEVLTDTFTSMASTLDAINVKLDKLVAGADASAAEVKDSARDVAAKVHRAIVAFQFYDKLVQRLDHVCASLASLSDLVGDKARLFDPCQWAALQEKIRSRYTMMEECEMFDAVMAGVPVKEAIERYMSARMREVEASGGDVEFF